MLIARVKATQEREVPELMRRLAAVEAFQSVGDEARNIRRKQTTNKQGYSSDNKHTKIQGYKQGYRQGYRSASPKRQRELRQRLKQIHIRRETAIYM